MKIFCLFKQSIYLKIKFSVFKRKSLFLTYATQTEYLLTQFVWHFFLPASCKRSQMAEDIIPVTDPATDTPPPVITETPAPEPKRFAKTINFAPAEFKALEQICTARIESGISTDWNHFLRQMIDYTLNERWKKPNGYIFARPENSQVTLKNTFENLSL